MKKLVALLLSVSCVLSGVSAFAEDVVDVRYNGKQIEFDVPAQIIDNRTMVPMRKIFETFGATVDWVEQEQGIVAIKGSTVVVMVIGKPKIIVTDISTGVENKIEIDVPPQIVDGRTLVPVRTISDSLGINVEWSAETRTVLLTTQQ